MIKVLDNSGNISSCFPYSGDVLTCHTHVYRRSTHTHTNTYMYMLYTTFKVLQFTLNQIIEKGFRTIFVRNQKVFSMSNFQNKYLDKNSNTFKVHSD